MVALGCLLDFLNIIEKHIHSFSPLTDVQVFMDKLDKSRKYLAPSVQTQQVASNTTEVFFLGISYCMYYILIQS